MDEPSVRYRGKYVLDFLKKNHQVSYDFIYPNYQLGGIVRFFKVYFEVLFFAKNNSLIVFQKIYTNGIYANLLKLLLWLRPHQTLYDIDDAEYVRRPDRTILYFVKNVSICTVGSLALKNYCQQFNTNVHLLTSPIIHHQYQKKQVEKVFTIGWIGYFDAHQVSLEKYVFSALLKVDFPIKLILLGVRTTEEVTEINRYFENNPYVQIEMPLDINWLDELSIYQRIQSFDIGVAPLINDAFNRAKSAFKLKQFLSCGVPVLASPTGENQRFIKNNCNGFLCDTNQDFLEKIYYFKTMDYQTYQVFSRAASQSFPNFDIQHFVITLSRILNS